MSGAPEEQSAAARRQAHQEGYRGRSRGLELGARFTLVAGLLAGAGPALMASWEVQLSELFQAPVSLHTAGAELASALGLLAGVLLGALVLLVLVAVLSRNFGARRRRDTAQGPAQLSGHAVRAALAMVTLGVVAFALRGVPAGAARGSAAELSGLTGLWGAWSVRVCLVLGLAMLAAGVLEWLAARARAFAHYTRAKEAGSQGRVRS